MANFNIVCIVFSCSFFFLKDVLWLAVAAWSKPGNDWLRQSNKIFKWRSHHALRQGGDNPGEKKRKLGSDNLIAGPERAKTANGGIRTEINQLFYSPTNPVILPPQFAPNRGNFIGKANTGSCIYNEADQIDGVMGWSRPGPVRSFFYLN